MEIREYRRYCEEEVMALYRDAGWTAYTGDGEALRRGFANSLAVLAAYEDDRLVGLLRAVGDGVTVVWVQDLLVLSAYRRRGIGCALLGALTEKYAQVRQIMLASDASAENIAFYNAAGFREYSGLGMAGFMKVK